MKDYLCNRYHRLTTPPESHTYRGPRESICEDCFASMSQLLSSTAGLPAQSRSPMDGLRGIKLGPKNKPAQPAS